MGLFGRKRRGINSAAAALNTPVPPSKVEVNQQATSWVGVLIVAVASVPFFGFLTWRALVYLARVNGSRYPEQSAVKFLINILIILIVILAAKIIADAILTRLLLHKQIMKDKDIEIIRLQQRQIQALPPQTAHRMTDEQARLYRAVMQVMDDAYKQIDDNGILVGKSQPWSKRSVGAIILFGETIPIGADSSLATGVKRYLMSADILLDDRTINLDRFPDLHTIERRLNYDFGPLVQLRSLPSPARTQAEWSIID